MARTPEDRGWLLLSVIATPVLVPLGVYLSIDPWYSVVFPLLGFLGLFADHFERRINAGEASARRGGALYNLAAAWTMAAAGAAGTADVFSAPLLPSLVLTVVGTIGMLFHAHRYVGVEGDN